MTTPDSPHESRLDRFAVFLAGGLLIAIAVGLFALLVPHLLGGWRAAVAVLVIGLGLGVLDVVLARALRHRGGRLPGGDLGALGVGLVVGLAGGALYAAIAGDVAYGLALALGATAGLLNAGFSVLWRAGRRPSRSD